jgi:uncharacterized protein (TIGR02246 family)
MRYKTQQNEQERLSMTAKSPEQLVEKLSQAIINGDMDAYLTLYEPEATLVRQDGHPATGYAAIREEIGPLLAMQGTATIEATKVVRGAGVALIYAPGTFKVTLPDGHPLKLEAPPEALVVARRQPNSTWRIVVHNPWGK